MTIDLNCDLGEGAGHDAELMALITSANIACGGHAGDETTMREAVTLAQTHGVGIGAHPGFEDREHFGRREMRLAPREAGELVLAQTARLRKVAAELGGQVRHVKLHGALYNMAARDEVLAGGIVEALGREARDLLVVAPAGSVLERMARAELGSGRVVAEIFADRGYERDGTLTPRGRPGALIDDPTEAAARVVRMVLEGVMRATDGTELAIRGDTVCLHGDGVKAVETARRIVAGLARAGVALRAPGAAGQA